MAMNGRSPASCWRFGGAALAVRDSWTDTLMYSVSVDAAHHCRTQGGTFYLVYTSGTHLSSQVCFVHRYFGQMQVSMGRSAVSQRVHTFASREAQSSGQLCHRENDEPCRSGRSSNRTPCLGVPSSPHSPSQPIILRMGSLSNGKTTTAEPSTINSRVSTNPTM